MKLIVVVLATVLVLVLTIVKTSNGYAFPYKIVEASRPYEKAKEECASMGMKLLVVRTAEKSAEVVRRLMSHRDHTNHSRIWLGIRRSYDSEISGGNDPNVWDWRYDSEPERDRVDHFLWHKGEPNNKGDERCVEMIISNNYDTKWVNRWNDITCSKRNSYICEVI